MSFVSTNNKSGIGGLTITSYRGLHYRYDEYGRVVEKRGRNGTQHYRWDAEHRLTEVAVIRGSTVRRYGYVYDAPGRRVEKHELDAEGKPYNRTTFLWDGMRLAQECRPGRSSSLYIYSDQGSHEPWRGWTGRRRAKRMRCCITIRT